MHEQIFLSDTELVPSSFWKHPGRLCYGWIPFDGRDLQIRRHQQRKKAIETYHTRYYFFAFMWTRCSQRDPNSKPRSSVPVCGTSSRGYRDVRPNCYVHSCLWLRHESVRRVCVNFSAILQEELFSSPVCLKLCRYAFCQKPEIETVERSTVSSRFQFFCGFLSTLKVRTLFFQVSHHW